MSNKRRARDPRRVFLADQAAGAAVQTQGHIARVAGEQGKGTTQDLQHPVVRHFIDRLTLGLSDGSIGSCVHLDPGAPQPMHWLPSKPELLCSVCMVAVGGVMLQQFVGTLPGNICGSTGGPLESVRVAVGHVLILGLCCPDCLDPDHGSAA